MSQAFTYLLLALAVVALLVAAVGITNVTLIAILERRTEIGPRRALGACGHTSSSSSSARRC